MAYINIKLAGQVYMIDNMLLLSTKKRRVLALLKFTVL